MTVRKKSGWLVFGGSPLWVQRGLRLGVAFGIDSRFGVVRVPRLRSQLGGIGLLGESVQFFFQNQVDWVLFRKSEPAKGDPPICLAMILNDLPNILIFEKLRVKKTSFEGLGVKISLS